MLFFLLVVGLSFRIIIPVPPGPIDPYLNGVFPDVSPANEAIEVVDLFPDIEIQSPTKVVEFSSSDDLLVLTKGGIVFRMNTVEQTKSVVLDLFDQTFRLGDGGAVGLVLHPEFWTDADKQEAYVYNRTSPTAMNWTEPAYNRLSKFKWDPSTEIFDLLSEEILIQQYDRSPWHNGGDMFFGNDGFLYITLGDEGAEEQQLASTQRLDGGFFSGIIRIDVDNDSSRSHPIRRQPLALDTPIKGWDWPTYSQGYSIPNDNPWLDESGSRLEEFYSLGLRSPYDAHYDAEREVIWIADVGGGEIEEVNTVRKGDNHQWPYLEGDVPSEIIDKPGVVLGQEQAPKWEYGRDIGIGTCIIGGIIYDGFEFPNLDGQYIFADFTSNKVVALRNLHTDDRPQHRVIINDLKALYPALAPKSKIIRVEQLSNGDILLCIMGEETDFPGKILRLKNSNQSIGEAPKTLSETGFFKNLSNLEPIDAAIPYTVNAPLWSDGAAKQRWAVIPNDGQIDTEDEKIDFRERDHWDFPAGTVFVKHFEMALDQSNPESKDRLETRFFILDQKKIGYGLSYRWNDEETEAYLVEDSVSDELWIQDDEGEEFPLIWNYPTQAQCASCHNSTSQYVLGVNTHQLNGDLYYHDMGMEINQLDYWNKQGLFKNAISASANYPRSAHILDDQASLSTRIMSYLDANCASCHNDNTNLEVDLDFSYDDPSVLRQYIGAATQSHASTPGGTIIKAGDHESSELWLRDASRDEIQMPPLATELLDQTYVDSLAKWINNLPEYPIETPHELLLFPNPVDRLAFIQIDESLPMPANLQVWTSTGRLVIEERIDNHIIARDYSHLISGNYVIACRHDDMRFTTRMVKI